MFKEWFAQYSWSGLSFLAFVAFLVIGYRWKIKKSLEDDQAIKYAALLVAIFLALWVLGLRFL